MCNLKEKDHRFWEKRGKEMLTDSHLDAEAPPPSGLLIVTLFY